MGSLNVGHTVADCRNCIHMATIVIPVRSYSAIRVTADSMSWSVHMIISVVLTEYIASFGHSIS